MSDLVTPAASGRSSRDWPPATPAPARYAPGRGSSPGSAVWPASVPDWPPCWPCGTAAPSSTSDGAHCAGRGETNACSSNTCVVFVWSSIGILRPPMMRPTTPHRDAEEDRTEETEETIIGRFSKKTPPKKTTISKCWNYCTFRLMVARRGLSHSDRPEASRDGWMKPLSVYGPLLFGSRKLQPPKHGS